MSNYEYLNIWISEFLLELVLLFQNFKLLCERIQMMTNQTYFLKWNGNRNAAKDTQRINLINDGIQVNEEFWTAIIYWNVQCMYLCKHPTSIQKWSFAKYIYSIQNRHTFNQKVSFRLTWFDIEFKWCIIFPIII